MKFIFLDIDGTLLSFGQAQPPLSAVQAVRQARENGHQVYINTGRCRCEVTDAITSIGFDGIICSNSLYIEERGLCLEKHQMEASRVQEIAQWLENEDVGFFFEGHDKVMATKRYFEQLLPLVGKEVIERQKKVFPAIQEAALSFDGIGKINFISRPGLCTKLKEQFGKLFQVNEWSFLGKDFGMGEITVLEASKANGVRYIIERHDAVKDDCYAFGDSAGDLSMIDFCGCGVAMGNAEDVLKQHADFITSDVDKDGLEKAFRHFGLIS